MKLHIKLSIFLCCMFLTTTLLFELIFKNYFLSDLKKQMGERALAVAKTISTSPYVLDAFQQENPSLLLQPYSLQVQKETDAEFVVIGNTQEIRYTHPRTDRIGHKMVGGDNTEVFKGKSVISESVGSLGPSLRGKAPIFDKVGNVIGVVSVGFLIKDINSHLSFYEQSWFKFSIIILALGIIASFFISIQVKKALNGFEPEQIAQLYNEQQAILNSIREGIIAINRHGMITIINETAIRILHLANKEAIIGRHIDDVVPNSALTVTALTGDKQLNLETILCRQHVIVNHVPVYNKKGMLVGAVSSFRSKSEINKLTEELTNTRKYAEGLRAQTHEYSNKLYTISGLIQLESYQEALDFIMNESNTTQHLVQFITTKITEPTIAGLLLSKYNQAAEKKIDFQLYEESVLTHISSHIEKNDLLTIIGNLIDNAIDAVSQSENSQKCVAVCIIDSGDEIIIEVIDNGVGIPAHIQKDIFKIGFTTKETTSTRGFGLAIVQNTVHRLHGYINLSSKKGETIFTVIIPKIERGKNDE
ncbi:MAG: ATP-binding protein [Bacillaceae bacterium]